jgi:hypothetical protein
LKENGLHELLSILPVFRNCSFTCNFVWLLIMVSPTEDETVA